MSKKAQERNTSTYLAKRLLSDSTHAALAKQYLSELSKDELIALLIKQSQEAKPAIPLSLFSIPNLSSLELIVRYLKEYCGLRNVDIAKQLSRSPQSIWITYRNSRRKYPRPLPIHHREHDIPLTVFNDRLSILESIVMFLKEKHSLRYREIGVLLNRNERTIWTTYRRAIQKR